MSAAQLDTLLTLLAFAWAVILGGLGVAILLAYARSRARTH